MEECGSELKFGNLSSYSPRLPFMVVDSVEECQNIHSVIDLPDEGTADLQHEPSLNNFHLELSNMVKGKMCLKAEPYLLNPTNLKMDKANDFSPCILDVDIEKGKKEIPNSCEESDGNLKFDDPIARVLQREICLQIGGKLMQFLVNHSPDLTKLTSRDKFVSERVYDTPSSRARKYKRSTSFNSRRVLLLFSILSCMGTIVLIYLTLRVRQMTNQ